MDALSEVLAVVRVRGSLFSRARGACPWGVSTRGAPGGIFHVVRAGSGVLRVEGQPDVRFSPGDLLVLPHGHPHVLADAPSSRPVWIRELPVEPGDDALPVVRAGPPGEVDADILCGSFRFDDEARAHLLPWLPPVLHAPGRRATGAWLEATMTLLADGVSSGRPGASVVVDRLAEVLFVQAVAAWVEDGGGAGWLAGLGDPPVARALGLLHAEPARPWSVDLLARRVGLSRTRLYARFTERVGEPPAAYLTRWRMVLARRALREEDLGLGELATRLGYGDAAAFSRAFVREVGQPPGAWRKEARGPAAAPA